MPKFGSATTTLVTKHFMSHLFEGQISRDEAVPQFPVVPQHTCSQIYLNVLSWQCHFRQTIPFSRAIPKSSDILQDFNMMLLTPIYPIYT